jgi:hypothetical protein
VEGLSIARRIARGYRRPRRWQCPGGAVYSQEESYRIQEARELGAPCTGHDIESRDEGVPGRCTYTKKIITVYLVYASKSA